MSIRLLYNLGKLFAKKRKKDPNVTEAGRWPDRDHTPVGRGDQPTVPERGAIPKGPTPDLTEQEGLSVLKKIREGKNWYIDPESTAVFEFRYGAGVEPRGFYHRHWPPAYVKKVQDEAIEKPLREARAKKLQMEIEAEELKRIRVEAAESGQEVPLSLSKQGKPIELDQVFLGVRINEMNRIAQKAGYKNFQAHMSRLKYFNAPQTQTDKLALQKYQEIFEELGPYTKDAELFGKTVIPREHFKYNKGGPVNLLKLNYGY